MPKRRPPELSAQQSLFEPAGLKEVPVGRAFRDERFLIGTSAFTAAGWQGSFYPKSLKSSDCLPYYATQFRTVEIDSTYYGTPPVPTVESWYRKTPRDFVFALKVPQIVTHTKALLGCEAEFDEFAQATGMLKEKLGPMLFQFPHFNKYEVNDLDDFLRRLRGFLPHARQVSAAPIAIEIRNKSWFTAELTDVLKEHNAALAMTDTSFVPRPWEHEKQPDFVTSDFAYIRWLGNRKGIEEVTTTWDSVVIDRTEDLRHWVKMLRELVLNKKLRAIFAFANNHYAGHGPATIRLLHELWHQ